MLTLFQWLVLKFFQLFYAQNTFLQYFLFVVRYDKNEAVVICKKIQNFVHNDF